MDKQNKHQRSSSRILSGPAVQGLPSKDIDAVPTSGGTPIKKDKDTSKLESLFDKLR